MKWQAAEIGIADRLHVWLDRLERKRARKRAARGYWHVKFAWLPVAIPRSEHDAIVVPRHRIWLEHYDRRNYYGYWERRSHVFGTPAFGVRVWEIEERIARDE